MLAKCFLFHSRFEDEKITYKTGKLNPLVCFTNTIIFRLFA